MWWRRFCLNQIASSQTSGSIWRKERLDNKNVKNAISSQLEIEGGFLPTLAGLIPFQTGTVLPALVVGALSGLASIGVQKLIANGLYLKKGSGVCRIETDGKVLYLGPASGKWFETVGNVLYLMKHGGLYDGRGLLLGPNSPLKKNSHSWYDFVILLSEKKNYIH